MNFWCVIEAPGMCYWWITDVSLMNHWCVIDESLMHHSWVSRVPFINHWCVTDEWYSIKKFMVRCRKLLGWCLKESCSLVVCPKWLDWTKGLRFIYLLVVVCSLLICNSCALLHLQMTIQCLFLLPLRSCLLLNVVTYVDLRKTLLLILVWTMTKEQALFKSDRLIYLYKFFQHLLFIKMPNLQQ